MDLRNGELWPRSWPTVDALFLLLSPSSASFPAFQVANDILESVFIPIHPCVVSHPVVVGQQTLQKIV